MLGGVGLGIGVVKSDKMWVGKCGSVGRGQGEKRSKEADNYPGGRSTEKSRKEVDKCVTIG